MQNAAIPSDRAVAVVTGGAQGIGRAIAQRLADEGFRIVVADLKNALPAAREMDADGWGVDLDVSDAQAVEQAVHEVLRRYGRIDVLVNNAGVYTSLGKQPFEQIPPEEWKRVFEVNVEGVWNFCRYAAAPMKKARSGSIVNISSASVAKGNALLLHYVASKGAVQAMTRVMARELGEFNVRVNTVSPGFTLSDGVMEQSGKRDAQKSAVRDSRLIHEDVLPRDIADAVAFLATNQSRMMTGQNLTVDGGIVMN